MIVGEERVPFYFVAGVVGFVTGAFLGIDATELSLHFVVSGRRDIAVCVWLLMPALLAVAGATLAILMLRRWYRANS